VPVLIGIMGGDRRSGERQREHGEDTVFFWGVLMGPRAFAVYGRNQPACMVVMVPGFGKMKSFRVVFLFIYDKYYSVIY
jgi:hypothetical protein